MRFYWFGRSHVDSFTGLIDDLEYAGFYGVLLPYVVGMPDQFIKVAHTINKKQKIKYMIAIRPYTISPQYLAAMCKSMDHVHEGRMMINFVSGQVDKYELGFGGVLGDITDNSTPIERKQYLVEYVKNFYSLDFERIKTKRPTVMVSGMSEEIFSLVEESADFNIVAYEAYKRNNGFRALSKPRVVSICPVILDSEEDIEEFKTTDSPQDMVPITKEGLEQLILNLKKDGINDIMFFSHGNDDQRYKIVEFIKALNNSNPHL